MGKNYLVVKDIIDQVELISQISKECDEDVIAISVQKINDPFDIIAGFVELHGYGIVLIEDNTFVSIRTLEDK